MRYKTQFINSADNKVLPFVIEDANSIKVKDGDSVKGLGEYLIEVATLTSMAELDELDARMTEVESVLNIVAVTGNILSINVPNVFTVSGNMLFPKPVVSHSSITIYALFTANASLSFQGEDSPFYIGETGNRVCIKIITFGLERVVQVTGV